MSNFENPRDEIHAGLREWARGHKPTMSAVEFLIGCDAVPLRYVHEANGSVSGATHWIDLDRLGADLEAGAFGGYSSGQQATLVLANSLYRGELDDWFWRLDGDRRQAFVHALAITTNA